MQEIIGNKWKINFCPKIQVIEVLFYTNLIKINEWPTSLKWSVEMQLFIFLICIQILNYVALQSSTKHYGLKMEKLSRDKKILLVPKFIYAWPPSNWDEITTNFPKDIRQYFDAELYYIISPLCKDLESS